MLSDKTAQQRVREFTDEFSLNAPIEARLLDMASESGELAREFLTSTSYGQKPFHPAPEWHQEMGDVYFALLSLAETTGTDLDAALDDAMQRYADRVHEHGSPGNPG